MNKNLLFKYIWLVDTIGRAGKITFEELNDRWMRSSLNDGEELPKRTFHNWRADVEELFDINIECQRKGGNYYYIENPQDIRMETMRRWLLNTFTVSNIISDSQDLKDRILLEDVPSGQKYLMPIVEAMREGREIRLNHKSYWKSEPGEYVLQPYCLKIFKQIWYVLGFCRERGALRIFSLDRILELELLDTRFEYPASFDPRDYFSDYFGVITRDNIKTETIEIKSFWMYTHYMRALPLHPTQEEIETRPDYSVFRYRLKPTLDFKLEILSRGSQIEVISPESFRREIAEEIERMRDMYHLPEK